ncbi:hypothetical protein K2Q08_02165 [Patescibacteria group bacterium]|nr:hypothetical protein [Patescibacteria group bacterium]
MPVSFEEQAAAPQYTSTETLSGMSGWLVRKKLAANQTSADLTLIVLAIILFGFAAFFVFRQSGGAVPISEESLRHSFELLRERTTAR